MKYRLFALGISSILLISRPDSLHGADPSCAPIANLPSVWLPLNGAADDLITGSTATLGGNTSYVAGKVNQGISLGTGDGYLRLPASADLDIGAGDGTTVELWMNPSQVASEAAVLEWSSDDGSLLGLHLTIAVYGSGSLFANLIDTSGVAHQLTTAGDLLPAGVYSHVALTYDRSSGIARYYLNGAEAGSANFGNIRLETTTGLWVGRRVIGSSPFSVYSGTMDEISLYKRALSATEIQSIYSAGSLGKCTEPVLPTILSQPSNQSVLPGENCSFTVTVVGTPPLTFQWLLGDTPISAATNSVFQIVGVATNQGGAYSVVVQNSVGSITSAVATLTVNLPPPMITLQPKPLTVLTGQMASFSIDATGIFDLSYQWYRESEPLAGETNQSLEIGNVSANDGGSYWATVSNIGGSVTSQVAQLSVVTPPPCLPAPTGMVAWWSFEGSGHDSVGENSVTFASEPAFPNGIAGRALYMNAAEVRPSVTGNQSLNIGVSEGFTIEGWIKPSSLGQQALVEWNNRAGSVGVHLYLSQPAPLGNGSGCLFANVFGVEGASHWIATPAGLVVADEWQHVALTFSKGGGEATMFLNGAEAAKKAFGVYTPQTGPDYDLLLGHRIGAGLQFPFTGGLDELTLYARALDPTEIALIHAVGSGAKCNGGVAPTIVSNPQGRSAEVGSSVSFSVGVAGSPPLTYQWRFEGTPIDGATNGTFTIENVQYGQSGNYSVLVTNLSGSSESSNAVLVVTLPPSRVRVVDTLGSAATDLAVPVQIVANGTENAAGFSISFNPAVLTFVGASLGSAIPAGSALIVNTNDAALGRIGMAVALPAEGTLTEGTQTLASVTLRIAPILNRTTLAINLGDQPTLRQVSDASANVVPSTFANGTLTILDSQFEGDVAPRPNGDRTLATIDWVQMGRYVARLDSIDSTNEFQRADCAPLTTKGNGLLSASDWVQAGRYATGLDPLTVIGGPTEPDEEQGQALSAAGGSGRRLVLTNANILPGQTNGVAVVLDAVGNENAVSFSVAFDAAKLRYVGVGKGSGSSGLIINLNTNDIDSGHMGVAVAASPGTSMGAGPRELFLIRFAALAAPMDVVPVTFSNSPVPKDVSDIAANTLPTDYVGALVSVSEPPGPPLSIARSGNSVLVTWTTNSSGFVLEASEGGFGSAWQPVGGVLSLGDQKLAIINAEGKDRFFRLKKQ